MAKQLMASRIKELERNEIRLKNQIEEKNSGLRSLHDEKIALAKDAKRLKNHITEKENMIKSYQFRETTWNNFKWYLSRRSDADKMHLPMDQMTWIDIVTDYALYFDAASQADRTGAGAGHGSFIDMSEIIESLEP